MLAIASRSHLTNGGGAAGAQKNNLCMAARAVRTAVWFTLVCYSAPAPPRIACVRASEDASSGDHSCTIDRGEPQAVELAESDISLARFAKYTVHRYPNILCSSWEKHPSHIE